MLLRLSKYDIQVKYVSSKSVLLSDTLSLLIEPGDAKENPGLDINITQILKVETNRLETLQEKTKCDSNMAQLTDLIIAPVRRTAWKICRRICTLTDASDIN